MSALELYIQNAEQLGVQGPIPMTPKPFLNSAHCPDCGEWTTTNNRGDTTHHETDCLLVKTRKDMVARGYFRPDTCVTNSFRSTVQLPGTIMAPAHKNESVYGPRTVNMPWAPVKYAPALIFTDMLYKHHGRKRPRLKYLERVIFNWLLKEPDVLEAFRSMLVLGVSMEDASIVKQFVAALDRHQKKEGTYALRFTSRTARRARKASLGDLSDDRRKQASR